MKWKFNELETKPELSSDLEWMLQSGQVSRDYFLETLAEAYYLRILHLTTSLLNDTRAAENATRRTFLKAVLDHHQYRSQIGVETWLFKSAYQAILQLQKRELLWKGIERLFSLNGELTNPAARDPSSENDRALLRAFDQLDAQSRNILILQYANSFSLEQIALISGESPSQVAEISERALMKISAEVTLEDESIQAALSRTLAMCWPMMQPSAEEIHAFTHSINSQANGRHALRGKVTTVREMAVIGLAILIVFLMIWGGNRFFLRPEEGSNLPGVGVTARPRLTATVHAASEKSLSSASTPSMVRPSTSRDSQVRPTITPTPTGVFYYVEEGDTLADIADRFGVEAKDLLAYNRIPDGAILAPRQPLVIPGSLPEGRSMRATPVTPVARHTISRPETTEDVFALLNPDVFPFNSLWLDAEVITYPSGEMPSSQERSKIQVWLSQRQFLLIGGPMGEEPEEVGIGYGGRMYIARPGEGDYFFNDYFNRSRDRSPMSVPLFFGLFMLFGDSDEIVDAEYSLLGDSQVAGREVWVVSQSSRDGERQAILWLDKETGFSLQVRRLDQPDIIGNLDSYGPSEVIVHSIQYDVDFPQELFNYSLPWRGGYAGDSSGAPMLVQDNRRQEEPALLPGTGDQLPSGYDLSGSRLSFRYPVNTDPLSTMIRSEIYADDYFLGSIQMGFPWEASCRRSEDGFKVVFLSSGSDTANSPGATSGAYYFDLRAVEDVHRLQPAKSGFSGDFAISPDNHTVAFWGCGGRDQTCGVYLHDMETHKWRKLTDNEEGASDFVWSPDGKTLVWMTSGKVVIAMDVEKGEITYVSDVDAVNQALPTDTPMDEWGTAFPPIAAGLEGCIYPPRSES